ncbi:HAD superfamily hydrolase (TIGR01509 family)/beta-phosphoglucomutase family hydrolase [Knoellia remsis]|uniref:Beta-phosphoglucomutase n=1 Tax=Knoellia remsis TaxID=407159 RepID=A0A2T0UQV6_9MICO|nr:beta-phosphoglucomutase family hydrolase [Knoellia remsis]PRY60319.1 HAD superfamily hydrolase (TIGR01509 family)/beta-phosphoglucomutase family hydrolase [Knoellia remsis]
MDWNAYDAALFDLDGVLTPTAEVHMRAWAEMFNAYLSAKGVDEPYTDQDYFDHVDGKPRYDGVRDFLASRGIELPEGDPSDSPDAETVSGLGNRKNDAFNAVLERDGVEPYAGSVRLIEALRERGTAMAVVSSSNNAPAVLETAGIAEFFPVVVSGAVATEQGLPGKPKPDTFLYAAEQLGVPKERAVVLEDAVSGVRAGRAGEFGLVVGVDRGAGAEGLTAAGADVVVRDLEELLP